MPRLALDSPVGRLTIFEQDGAITALVWGDKSAGPATPLLQSAKRQLIAYFERKRREFDLPLAPEGTADEKRIWAAMAAIPYGETRCLWRDRPRPRYRAARRRPCLRTQPAADPPAVPPRHRRRRQARRLFRQRRDRDETDAACSSKARCCFDGGLILLSFPRKQESRMTAHPFPGPPLSRG